MGLITFPGGVHPPSAKVGTQDKGIRKAALPEQVYLPLGQHVGAPSVPLVSPGERVLTGQKIAKVPAFVSAPLHASISGEVKETTTFLGPSGVEIPALVIQTDGRDESVAFSGRAWESCSPEEIRKVIQEAGIVGLGGAAFPTHVKLSPPAGKKIDTYLLNGAECEPYLTCDYRLMVERAKEIIQGFKILLKAVGAKCGYVGIEENKPRAIRVLENALAGETGLELKILKTKYPQGGEKQLIKAILGREVPSGGLPFDVGVMVSNVGTAFACYEALTLGKPLIERVVTVTGSGVKNPANLSVRLGTLVADLISACGGFSQEPGKVILGGPMMGLAQCTDQIPVVKGTSGILVQTRKEVMQTEASSCIRCGKCIEVCPMRLMPNVLGLLSSQERFAETEPYGAMDCMECGACAYRCPAKIPLVHLIKHIKQELSKLKTASEKVKSA